ncbi:DgyrCDS11554 [Dimorphilus gyrociliatus]|uniref:DgyrCDS11554 n=1 Tax=Dimorphilus gyrociliatus TaxID=2664684 RepID=A0A7I8W4M0_9ANNE|nr:DgyrCDS11554 [Dimorphilus gyrociliatus]
MPSVCIERVEMTRHQYQGLKTYIMGERRRKQKELELGEEQEKKRRQREEERRKKEQEQRISLETITKQLHEKRNKLTEMKNEKTQLFGQLKKVISEEDENKKRIVQERNEQLLSHSLLAPQVTGYPAVPIPTMLNKPSLSKRPHSPDQSSPVYGKAYKAFSQETPFAPKMATTAATSTTGSFVPAYPSMHAYQYPSITPYSSQHLLATTKSLQQQLEHANSKAGFSADDKYKLQQQLQRGPVPAPQQPNAGSIVSGYPVRTQTNPSSAFTPTLTGQRVFERSSKSDRMKKTYFF